MLTFRSFIGSYRHFFTVTIESNGEYFTLPPQKISDSDRYLMVMNSVTYTLRSISEIYKKPFKIIFFCDDFDISYDYNNFIKKNQKTGDDLKDSLWNEVKLFCNSRGIAFEIRNNDEYANKIGGLFNL